MDGGTAGVTTILLWPIFGRGVTQTSTSIFGKLKMLGPVERPSNVQWPCPDVEWQALLNGHALLLNGHVLLLNNHDLKLISQALLNDHALMLNGHVK